MLKSVSNSLNPEVLRIVDAARGVWLRRLIDHSRANSLLYYRDLKTGTLDLTAESEAVDRLLAGDKLTLEALASQDITLGNQDHVMSAQADEDAIRKVRSALVALQRKALSNLEEKGIETLHLAMGMATWPAPDGGRPYDAPLLLLPARIETRARARDDLRLTVAVEPQINPVLLYVLEENHAIRIDAAAVLRDCGSEDESGLCRIDPEGVAKHIEQATASVPNFKVNRRVILANFQFAKMAMVEDLKKNGTIIAANPIVAAIAGHQDSRQKLAQATIDTDPAQLDERPAANDYLVLDADSTQQRAIVHICKGQSGVVQGPPGTGKSQTISNLIAQCVAEGRRVLFVAEKRAALDAVIKRLTHPDVGLGHLVLDLHGASVSRKEVMARLAHSLHHIRTTPSADGAAAIHREFEARRKCLNEHARRINQARQPTGLSVNRMIGQLLRLPPDAKSTTKLRGETLASITAERADEVKQCILDGAANPRLLLGSDPSPWNNASIKDGHSAQAALDLAARASEAFWPQFKTLLERVAQSLGVSLPKNLNEAGSLIALLCEARNIRENYRAEIYSSSPEMLARALKPSVGGMFRRTWAYLTCKSYRAARNTLSALRYTPTRTANLRTEALMAENHVSRWNAIGATSSIPVEAEGEAELEVAYSALSEAIKQLSEILAEKSFAEMPMELLATRLQELAADQRTAYQLPNIYSVRSRLLDAGLSRFLEEIRQQELAPAHWAARFEYIWLNSSIEMALASDSSLATFNGFTHEQIVADFARLDRERIRLAAALVRRLHAERAIEAMNKNFDQTNLVKAEANKKTRHIPVRELLARAPDVLTRIAPCWVASPLSVSQLLDGDRRHFDIVVFDEASQILQEEAIPAIYRAEQVVVAGDRHQLPPTTFFATSIEDDDESSMEDEEDRAALKTATAAIGGFESLLGTLEAFLPNWLLEWHYRSEDERLITFSNTHIYSGRLVSFPSARNHEAIRHILVANDSALGGQEESASREIEEVVRLVLHHADTRPNESLGVITMGIKHANRLQATLDRDLYLRPDLADFFSLDKDERFFVKNLETVQGDERDAIILSIGYGKSANGDLPHRFGPLTQDVGYRRLNVAVTRAKRRMCTVSSFSHDEIDLNRSGSRGVQLLKAYLDYAAGGGSRLPEEEHAGEVALNPFEADIRDALEAKGIVTRPQFGASRYRIDLVAMHPIKTGRPVLAIECDGASYHSGATARDRDRLRQSHLERLGWRFHRIWSTDWFYNREKETSRAYAAYEKAVRISDLADTDVAPKNQQDTSEPATHKLRISNRLRRSKPYIPNYESIEQYSDLEFRKITDWIESDGLLRTDEELIREIYQELPFRRLGGRIRNRLLHVAQSARQRRKSE